MKAADIMSSRVISTTPDASVDNAVHLMLLNHISGLPVLNKDGALVGIVTEGDFLRRPEIDTERRRPDWLEFLVGPGRLAEEYVRSHGRTVSDVMTTKVVSVSPSASLSEVVKLMEKHHIKRVLVVEGGRVKGVVTRQSILQALAVWKIDVPPATPPDSTIRLRVIEEIYKLPWTPRASLNVLVQDGSVHLWGVILDERQRKAMRLAAQNVTGVKEVHDHLVWVEPISGVSFESPDDSASDGAGRAH